MTDKQKQAIRILNGLLNNGKMNENEYYLVLDFVVGNVQPPFWFERWPQTEPQPIDPIYGKFGITCTDSGQEEPNPKKELSYGDKLIMENKSPI